MSIHMLTKMKTFCVWVLAWFLCVLHPHALWLCSTCIHKKKQSALAFIFQQHLGSSDRCSHWTWKPLMRRVTPDPLWWDPEVGKRSLPTNMGTVLRLSTFPISMWAQTTIIWTLVGTCLALDDSLVPHLLGYKVHQLPVILKSLLGRSTCPSVSIFEYFFQAMWSVGHLDIYLLQHKNISIISFCPPGIK